MMHLPVLRFGQPYQSLETEPLHHFLSGEVIAEVSQANAGLIKRDLRKIDRARAALRAIPCDELLKRSIRAAELFESGTLTIHGTEQTPDDFVRCLSATTGMPEALCRLNRSKLVGVLSNLEAILHALMRDLDFDILTRGFGEENGVPVSYQATTPSLGIVLPSNSPGVHGLWLPVLALQIGLMLKPGSQEPWTPWRMAQAFLDAGIPEEALGIYPGPREVGTTLIGNCPRTLLFGSQQTIDQYAGNPGVRVHGPGFSKILLGDDVVDDWERYLDLMETSVLLNGGRGCINASGIWASRHTEEIAEALAERLAKVDVLPPDHDDAVLSAFTIEGHAQAIDQDIETGLEAGGADDVTARHRDTPRLEAKERCGYLRPTVVHCESPESPLAGKEYMFPFAAVVRCPQAKMIEKIGPTLVATTLTADEDWCGKLLDAPHVDRLNVGPVPTTQLNWLQPHEGNLIDFLFRARAYQAAPLATAGAS